MPNDELTRRALANARASFADNESRRRRLTLEINESAAALKELLRRHPPDDERVRRAQAEHARRALELEQVRTQVAEAKRAVNDRLADWLEPMPGIPNETAAAAEEISRLSAAFPIVLFPIRIETRFARTETGAELNVRIYPDTISANRHDLLLTAAELKLG